MMKSWNVVFTGKGEVNFKKEEEADQPKEGEVLCTASKSLVSIGTELRCLLGEADDHTYWSEFLRFPSYPGYSMAGTVLKIGSGVTKVKPGDRITAPAKHKQVFTVKEEDAIVIPESISDEEAAWAVLARTTQIGFRRAGIQLGETAVVVGLGVLGQLVVQYLRAAGCREVIAVDSSRERLELALQSGATHRIQTSVDEAGKYIKDLTRGRMADVVFDVTGASEVLAPATMLLRKFGRLVLLGDTTHPSNQFLGPRVVSNSISIIGAHGNAFQHEYSPLQPWPSKEMIGLFFDFLLQRRMSVKHLITHRYSPMEAPRVYAQLLEDRSSMLGIIYDWEEIY